MKVHLRPSGTHLAQPEYILRLHTHVRHIRYSFIGRLYCGRKNLWLQWEYGRDFPSGRWVNLPR